MGVIPTKKSLVQLDKIPAASFCRRRLAVVMVRLKMAENVKEACTFIEQGHVRVGPETVTDPAFHVTRTMEDFVTWVGTSNIRWVGGWARPLEAPRGPAWQGHRPGAGSALGEKGETCIAERH